MKTIKFGKKEYVIIERSKLDEVLSTIAFDFRKCEITAEHFKSIDDVELWKEQYMDDIARYAVEGYEHVHNLFHKEV